MKNMGFELTALARLDVLNIWNSLAEESSLDVADYLMKDIEAAICGLVEWPGKGHPRGDLTKRKLLFYRVHSYLIIYRRDTVPLQIIRILHGARDIGALLKK